MRTLLVAGWAVLGSLILASPVWAHGDTVPADEVWTRWSVEPLALVPAVLALACFVHGWLRLRRRGRRDHAGWDRLVLFTAGIAVVLLGIVSPLDPVAEEYLQSAHMLQHVLIADLGVALLVVAARGPLAVFLLPRRVLVPLARATRLRAILRTALRPGVTVAVWLGTVVAWHIPAVYEQALAHRAVHDLQHVSFVLVGTLLWVQLVDPTRHRRLTIRERIGLAVVVFWVGQILAYVILFDPSPLFDTYVQQDERLLGLSPLTDQKLAGVVMMVEQAITIGACLAVLVRADRRRRSGRSAALEHAAA
jgi:cytochrome c oxidase assembly factor CtaG